MSKSSEAQKQVKFRMTDDEYESAVREAAKRGITVAALALQMYRAAAAEFLGDF